MKRKPWPIIILALLHILAPIGNLFLNAYKSSRGLLPTWNFWNYGLPKTLLISYVILPPIAGVFIFICKRWSYWGYLVCLGLIFLGNVYAFWTNMTLWSFVFLVGILLVDFLAVAYFVVPSVRSVYFDPRLRWWETAPRYSLSLDGRINEQNGIIKNISIGGLFIEAWSGFEQNQKVELEWTFENQQLKVPGRIVFRNTKGYGVQFQHTPATSKSVKDLVQVLQQRGLAISDRKAGPEDGFAHWLKKLFTQGEGLFPKK